MSMAFLERLNGNADGAFREWLRQRTSTPRMAWYPSAGRDFRDLLYLSDRYSERAPAAVPDVPEPELFLHTDYFPWGGSFLDSPVEHDDGRTRVTIESIEELPRCDVPVDRELVAFAEGGPATGRVVALQVKIESNGLGTKTVPVLYAFCENAAFCHQVMLPTEAQVSHLVQVRFGGGCGGGGMSQGAWLLDVLDPLRVECFISDGHLKETAGDRRVRQLYSGRSDAWHEHFARREEHPRLRHLQKLRTIPAAGWSNHGAVSWYRVAPVP